LGGYLHDITDRYGLPICAPEVCRSRWKSILAASIFVTLSGPPGFCDAKAPISVCASITILVPISWLAATLRAYSIPCFDGPPHNSLLLFPVLGYFVAMSTLCITHLREQPDLWFTSIYSMTWFADDAGATNRRSLAPQLPPLESSGHTRLSVISRRHSTSSLPRDVENQSSSGSPDINKPLPSPAPSNIGTWWGRLVPGRPGKDHPFRFRRAKALEYKWWVKGEEDISNNDGDQGAGDKAPPEYPGSKPPTPGESRFVPYPSIPSNEDEPIPVDNRSEWVHAERALES
jgi:hypothetical protein